MGRQIEEEGLSSLILVVPVCYATTLICSNLKLLLALADQTQQHPFLRGSNINSAGPMCYTEPLVSCNDSLLYCSPKISYRS